MVAGGAADVPEAESQLHRPRTPAVAPGDWAAGKDQSLVVGFLRGNLGGRSARDPEEGVSNEVVYVFVEGLGEDVAEVG